MTEEQVTAILSSVAAGESVERSCEAVGTSAGALWTYRRANPAVDAELSKARAAGMHALMDKVLDVTRALVDVDNKGVPRRALPQVPPKLLKLGIDSALRVAGKLNPKDYGDRVEHKHTHGIDLASVLALADARVRTLDARRTVYIGDARVVPDEEAAGLDALGLGPPCDAGGAGGG